MSQMNPDQYNGASLIGLRGIVVKSHADQHAFVQAISMAMWEAQQLPLQIRGKLEAFYLICI